MFLEDFISEF